MSQRRGIDRCQNRSFLWLMVLVHPNWMDESLSRTQHCTSVSVNSFLRSGASCCSLWPDSDSWFLHLCFFLWKTKSQLKFAEISFSGKILVQCRVKVLSWQNTSFREKSRHMLPTCWLFTFVYSFSFQVHSLLFLSGSGIIPRILTPIRWFSQ